MADPFTSRPYAGPADLEAMQAFLRRARPPQRLADYPGLTDLRELAAQPETLAHTRLWFDPGARITGGRLSGFAWASEYNSIVIEPDPACGPDLEQALLDWAIPTARRLAVEREETEAPTITCRADDLERIAGLEQRGFQRLAETSLHMRRPLDQPIPEPLLPAGFTIRPFQGEAEIQAWVALHRAAFGTEFMTVDYRREMSGGPDYDPELDLLAVAPDGRLAGYVVGSYPAEENALTGRNVGYTDPVATHPDFQGRGLAANLLLAALQRLKARGAAAVLLGTSSENLAMQAAARKAGFTLESEQIWFACPSEP